MKKAAVQPQLKSSILLLLAFSAFSQEQASKFKPQNAPLLADIPNYTCLESIDQSATTPTGQEVNIDLLRVNVGVGGRSEMYAWANSPGFSDMSLARMVANGFNTAGIFSNLARRLLTLDSSQIQYLGEENLGDERAQRFAFHVPGGPGGWQISSRSQNGTDTGEAGEDGMFWIERKGLILRKIDVRATAIPGKLRLKSLRIIVNYEVITIGGRRVLLPSQAVVKSGLKSDLDRQNRITFNHCHAFRSESRVSFADTLESEQLSHSAISELPPALQVPIELLSPIHASDIDSSDLLDAAVSRSVSYRGREIIHKGARVAGHVFRERSYGGFEIEIDEIDTVYGWLPFYAQLKSNSAKKGNDLTPGVAVLEAPPDGEIPAGTQMVWITEQLVPKINYLTDKVMCPMCFGPAPY